MTHTETIAILRRYNVWRRGNLEGAPQPDPREIGLAIDAAIEIIESAEEDRALCDKLAGILTRTANVLKGEPKPLHRHSWHDLPDVALNLVRTKGRTGGIEMIDTNELRRLAQDQEWIGRWYDAGCETLMAERDGEHEEVAHPMPIGLVPYLVAVQPAAISELLDRLEAAESDGLEQARLNGMGGEREAALLAKLEATEKERDALRAKVERMERQEPVAEIGQQYTLLFVGGGSITGIVERHGIKVGDKLYALPGAQPAPSEQDESVRKAWSRFSNELHRSPDAPYPGMSQAFEQHFSQSFTDRDWRAESGTWAAAWKAAKRHGAQPAPSVPENKK